MGHGIYSREAVHRYDYNGDGIIGNPHRALSRYYRNPHAFQSSYFGSMREYATGRDLNGDGFVGNPHLIAGHGPYGPGHHYGGHHHYVGHHGGHHHGHHGHHGHGWFHHITNGFFHGFHHAAASWGHKVFTKVFGGLF